MFRPAAGREAPGMESHDGVQSEETPMQRTVRRLFKKAVMVNKKHSASWVAWAKFEQRLGNLGKR